MRRALAALSLAACSARGLRRPARSARPLPLRLLRHPRPPRPAVAPPPAPPTAGDKLFADALRAYHAALLSRRLALQDLRKEDVAVRVAEGEQLMATGRVDEAIARLAELVEHPQFELYADSEDGRAATFRLGDALATAGIYGPARGYLRRSIEAKGAWDGAATWARRAVRRMVDVALESEEYAQTAQDLAGVPASAPAQVRGEIAYMNGRAQEAAAQPGRRARRLRDRPAGVPLLGAGDVPGGAHRRRAGQLQGRREPALQGGRPEAQRDDDARLRRREVLRRARSRAPRPRAHRARAGPQRRRALLLLPRPARLRPPRRGALRGGDDALREEGLRRRARAARRARGPRRAPPLPGRGVGARRVGRPRALPLRRRRQEARRRSSSATSPCATPPGASPRTTLRCSACSRRCARDPTRAAPRSAGRAPRSSARSRRSCASTRRTTACSGAGAVLEREASGLVYAVGAIGDMQRTLATNGGVRPSADAGVGRRAATRARRATRSRASSTSSRTSRPRARRPSRSRPLRQQLSELKARLAQAGRRVVVGSGRRGGGARPARPAARRRRRAGWSSRRGSRPRAGSSADAETALAKDALHRLDLRLSRLLRRARLGRIESVLGRKRALEVEVEAIRLGYLPQDAVDSLDAARFLEDNEEYWPFEGDDWPDEYVGSEIK